MNFPSKAHLPRPTASQLLSAALFAIFAGATLFWLSLDRTPPNWDDAWYLTNSLNVYDSLTQHGIPGYFSKLNSVFGFKAPLIAALPTPFYLLIGRRWHAAYLVNIVAMLVLFAALYRIARRYWSTRSAVFAIAISGTIPLLYGLERWYLVDYALTALVAVTIATLMEPGSLERPLGAVLFGTLCGLGFLLKAAFLLFLLPSFLYVYLASRNRGRSLLLAAIPCLVLALPWYLGHWRPTLANAFDAGFGLSATLQGTGAIFSLHAIGTYFARVAVSGLSIYYSVLAAGLILWTAARRANRPTFPRILLCWMIPFAIFLFGGNKDLRYIAPILPAFALVVASLLDSFLPAGKIGTAWGAVLLVFPFLQMAAVSFGVPYHAPSLVYARRFNPKVWPLDEMLRVLAARSLFQPNRHPLIVVGADRATLNSNNIELTSVALQLPFDVETTAHENDLTALMDRLQEASFFIYEDGGEAESTVLNPHIGTLIQWVRSSGLFTEIPYARRLPDGGVVRLFQQTPVGPNPAESAPEQFVIDFGRGLALTDEILAKTSDSVVIRYRWRGVPSGGIEYWSFTHLLDSAGKIVAQRDRPLPAAESGASSWQEVHLRLPAEVPAAGFRLRIGVYDPQSGTRLRIALPPAAASRFTLTDQDTALITPY